MFRKKKGYKRLPGKGKTLFGYNTLWIGPDHLLAVDFSLASEEYKRFYYGDIQTFVTRKTLKGKVWNLIFAGFMAIYAVFAIMSGEGFSIFWWVCFSLTAFLFLSNCLLGPTCVCYLETAVQTEKLLPLNRLRTAGKVINRLKPFIEQAQGRLEDEVLRSGLSNPSQGDTISRNSKLFKAAPDSKATVHYVLFSLLVSDALMTVLDLFYNHVALTLFTNGLLLAAGVFMIISLVKQSQSHVRTPLFAVTWLTAGYLGYSVIAGYILLFSGLVKTPHAVIDQWSLIKSMSALKPLESPFLSGLYIISICFSLVLGILGFVLIPAYRKKQDVEIVGIAPSVSKAKPGSNK